MNSVKIIMTSEMPINYIYPSPALTNDHVKRMPYFSFPRIWNELPDLKLTNNATTFKIALKYHLHSLVADMCA